jgi:hypothetical protein
MTTALPGEVSMTASSLSLSVVERVDKMRMTCQCRTVGFEKWTSAATIPPRALRTVF